MSEKTDDNMSSVYCSTDKEIIFADKTFCFTGEFELGSRSKCASIVIKLGAKVSKSITKKLNYLVIGSHESELWINGSYGRKIEKALEYRTMGTGISIISEAYFSKFIDIDISIDIDKINNEYIIKRPVQKKSIVNKKENFIVFDLETTGFSATYDEIIEIGAVKITSGADKYKTLNILIRPSRNVSKKITSLTGISNEILLNATTIDNAIVEFYNFIEDFPLVAHNSPFDIKFLLKAFKDNKLDFRENEVVNTLPLARRAFPELDNHKLITLIKHLNISVKNNHRALDDSIATLEVYNKIIDILT